MHLARSQSTDPAAPARDQKLRSVLWPRARCILADDVGELTRDLYYRIKCAWQLMPPMVVFKYERVPSVIINELPNRWAFGRTESGWMTSATFFEYIANIFHPWLINQKITLPVVLFVDGQSSHLTYSLSEFCSENGIHLVALHPNATHIIQPIDPSKCIGNRRYVCLK
jgi:hypothetical protein